MVSHMGSDDDHRTETPPGFGQTLGSPQLAPGIQARPASTTDHAADTDALIREDVARVLADSSDDTQGVTATVSDAEVTLEGTVADTLAKETLETAIERVPGVKRVHSQLRTT
jgi:osmotically-inducible protein OsmY